MSYCLILSHTEPISIQKLESSIPEHEASHYFGYTFYFYYFKILKFGGKSFSGFYRVLKLWCVTNAYPSRLSVFRSYINIKCSLIDSGEREFLRGIKNGGKQMRFAKALKSAAKAKRFW
ncbi:hypothetical protein V6Z11_A12G060200 [Gossypium hirsutum]